MAYYNPHNQTVLDGLRRLRYDLNLYGTVPDKEDGICHNAAHLMFLTDDFDELDASAAITNACCDLGYTQYYYPVEHPTMDSESAYRNAPLWDMSTEYGRNRRKLLDDLIEHFEKLEHGDADEQ